MTAYVLDASALLAYLTGEPGVDVVAEALSDRAAISAANYAEVLSKLADEGEDPKAVARRLETRGLAGRILRVVALEPVDAVAIAEFRDATRAAGLSLADRACLALGRRLRLPVLTADRQWTGIAIGVDVHLLR